MRSENDKIKELFSSKLGDFEPELPNGIWDEIAKKLPSGDDVAPIQRAKKTSLYRKISVGIAGVAAAIILCFVLLLPNGENVVELSDNITTQQQPVVNNIAEKKSTLLATVIEKELPPKSTYTEKTTKLTTLASDARFVDTVSISDSDEGKIETDKAQESESVEVNNDQEKIEQPIEKDINIEEKIEQFANSGNTDLFIESEKNKKPRKKGFSFSLGGNTGLAKGYDDRTTTANVFAINTPGLESASEDNKVKKYIPIKMDHRQPISFGLTISKEINSKVSLETGLVYTYLSSKAKTDRVSDTKRYDSQIFHYFGIPLSVNYNFAEYHKAKFYFSGGGMIQKDMQGRLKGIQKQVIFQGEAESEFKEEIEQKNIQFSVSSKLGVTYPLYNKLHAYTTVGGAYYFDAKNDYKTIYSDRKFQLDVNIGLKLNF